MIGGPGAAGERRRREIGIPERARGDVFGQLDEVVRPASARRQPRRGCRVLRRPRTLRPRSRRDRSRRPGRRICEWATMRVAAQPDEVVERLSSRCAPSPRPCPTADASGRSGRWHDRASPPCTPAPCRSRGGSSSARDRTRRCRRCRRTPCRETPASAAPSSPARAAEWPDRRDRRSRSSPSTFISNSSVSGSMSGSDGNVFDEEIASAPPRNAPRASTTMSVVDGVSFAHTGTRATSFTARVTDGDELGVLADVRAHVRAIHVRTRQVQLERVGAFVLAGLRQRLPMPQLGIAARARHDRRDEHARRMRLLDAARCAAPTSRASCRR